MRRILFGTATALVATVAIAGIRPEPAQQELQPARNIRSVWDLSVQPCNGGGANAYSRDSEEASVKSTKRLDLPELGYRFTIPQLPNVEETVVKVHLNDHSRGVTDHYLLLADQDLEAPFAAIVVTDLPKGMESRASVFQAARTLQEGLSMALGQKPALREIGGPYGPALEMLVPNRVGTHCFPTAKFAEVPAGVNIETMGISRFVFDRNRLIEFSLVIRVTPESSVEEREKLARSVMDDFWRSLAPI